MCRARGWHSKIKSINSKNPQRRNISQNKIQHFNRQVFVNPFDCRRHIGKKSEYRTIFRQALNCFEQMRADGFLKKRQAGNQQVGFLDTVFLQDFVEKVSALIFNADSVVEFLSQALYVRFFKLNQNNFGSGSASFDNFTGEHAGAGTELNYRINLREIHTFEHRFACERRARHYRSVAQRIIEKIFGKQKRVLAFAVSSFRRYFTHNHNSRSINLT